MNMLVNGEKAFSSGLTINNLVKGSIKSKLIRSGKWINIPSLNKRAMPIKRIILIGFILLNC